MARITLVIFVVLIAYFLHFFITRKSSFPPFNDLPFKDFADSEYDYVIIGGGSAGNVVANRLSADPQVSVLLLEAGGDGRAETLKNVTTAFFRWNDPRYVYGYTTDPQKYACHNNNDKLCRVVTGRGLGGGSSVNCMVYVRGSRQDFDNWAAMGADGWSYKDVLPYFIKAENVRDNILRWQGNRGCHGPQYVSRRKTSVIEQTLMEAVNELGLKYVEDYNSYDAEGFSKVQSSIYGDERASTARTYLFPVMDRPNLHVVIDAKVSKILFEDKAAIGVNYIKGGVTRTVRARREVISSAGSIGSTKLLMLSGVGPKKHLESLKIPVVADLPVGENFHDHVYVIGPSVYLNSPNEVLQGLSLQTIKDALNGNELEFGGCGVSAIGLYRIPHADEDRSTGPNVHIMVFDGGRDQEQINIEHGNIKQFPEYFNGSIPGMSYSVMVAYPKTRGTVTLKSKKLEDDPVIKYQHLNSDYERTLALETTKIILRIIHSKAMKKLGARLRDAVTPYPPCAKFSVTSDDYWLCFNAHQSSTMYHYTGTCRMGRVEAKTTVVDPRLRVKGLKKLRVVDSSVMPEVTLGNTNAPTIMIGEKGADMIIQDHSN